MSQNHYDDPVFFEGYLKLRQRPGNLNDTLEQPALRALVGDVAGSRVVDLGCGAGGLCRWLRKEGAAEVLGVDISEKMLKVARSQTCDGITYVLQSLETLELAAQSIDLVVSSLALHYLPDLGRIATSVKKALCSGGRFVFSIEHPYSTAISPQRWIEHPETGRRVWPLEGYKREGLREKHWMVEGIQTYHRSMETTVSTMLQAGFLLETLQEPLATPEAVEKWPELERMRERPPFLLLAWKKP